MVAADKPDGTRRTRPSFLPADCPARDSILGDLSLYERTCAIETKGNLIGSRRRYLELEFDSKVFQAVADELGPAARGYLLDPPLDFAWAPYEPLIELDYFITRVAMSGTVSRMKHFGAEVAKYDLPLKYRVLFKVGSPAFVFKRLNMAYSAYLRPGRLEIETEPRSGTVVLHGAAFPLYMCSFGMAGWMRAALELSGGKNVAVKHSHCVHRGDPRCTYHASWQ